MYISSRVCWRVFLRPYICSLYKIVYKTCTTYVNVKPHSATLSSPIQGLCSPFEIIRLALFLFLSLRRLRSNQQQFFCILFSHFGKRFSAKRMERNFCKNGLQ